MYNGDNGAALVARLIPDSLIVLMIRWLASQLAVMNRLRINSVEDKAVMETLAIVVGFIHCLRFVLKFCHVVNANFVKYPVFISRSCCYVLCSKIGYWHDTVVCLSVCL